MLLSLFDLLRLDILSYIVLEQISINNVKRIYNVLTPFKDKLRISDHKKLNERHVNNICLKLLMSASHEDKKRKKTCCNLILYNWKNLTWLTLDCIIKYNGNRKTYVVSRSELFILKI